MTQKNFIIYKKPKRNQYSTKRNQSKIDEKYLQSLFTEDIPPKFKVSDKKVKTGIFSISVSTFKDMEDLPAMG